jgi:hypothetical protein
VSAVASVLGMDVDDPCRAIPILRGQQPVHQADALDEIGVQQLRERRICVDVERQHDPVHLVLDARVLVANVDLLILIERDPLSRWRADPAFARDVSQMPLRFFVLLSDCEVPFLLSEDADFEAKKVGSKTEIENCESTCALWRAGDCADRGKYLMNKGWRRKGPGGPTGLQNRARRIREYSGASFRIVL